MYNILNFIITKYKNIILFWKNPTKSKIIYFFQVLIIKQLFRISLSIFYNYIFFSKPILFYFWSNLFLFSQKFIFFLHFFSIWILFFIFFGILLVIPFSYVRFGFLISKVFFFILRIFFENVFEKGLIFLCSAFLIILRLKFIIFSFFKINLIIKNYFKLTFFFIMQFIIIYFLMFMEQTENVFLPYIRFFYCFFELNLFSTSTFCRPIDESNNLTILKNLYAIHEFHSEVSKELFLLRTFIYPTLQDKIGINAFSEEKFKQIIQQNQKYITDIEVFFSKTPFSAYKMEYELISNINELNEIYNKLYNNCIYLRKKTQNSDFIYLIQTNKIFYKSIKLPNFELIKNSPACFNLEVRKPFVMNLKNYDRLNIVADKLIKNSRALTEYKKILYRAHLLHQSLNEFQEAIETQENKGENKEAKEALERQLVGKFENAKQYISKFLDVGVVKNDPIFTNRKLVTNNFQIENTVDIIKIFNRESTASLQSCQTSLEIELVRLKEQLLNNGKFGLDPELQKKNIKIIEELSQKKLLIDSILTRRLKISFKDRSRLEFPPNIFEKNTLHFSDIYNITDVRVTDEIQIPKKNANSVGSSLFTIFTTGVELNNKRSRSAWLKFKNESIRRQILIDKGVHIKELYDEFYKNTQTLLTKKVCTVDNLINFRKSQYRIFDKMLETTEIVRKLDKNTEILNKLPNLQNDFYSLRFAKPILNPNKNLKLPSFLTETALKLRTLSFDRQNLELRMQCTKDLTEHNYLKQEIIKMENLEQSVQQRLNFQKENFNFAFYDVNELQQNQLTPLQISQIQLFNNLKYTLEKLTLKINDGAISERDRKHFTEEYMFLENNFKKLESRIGILRHPMFLNKINFTFFNENIIKLNAPCYYKSFIEKVVAQSIICNQFKSDITFTRKEIEEMQYRIDLSDEKAERGKPQLGEKLEFLKDLYMKSTVEYKNRIIELNKLFRNRPVEIESLNANTRLQTNILNLEKNIRMDVEKDVENFISTICENKKIPNPRTYKFDKRFLEERIAGLKLSHETTCDNIRNLSSIERITDDVKKKIKLEEIKVKIIRRELNIALDKLKQFKVPLPNTNIKTPIISFNSEPTDISPIGVPAITGEEYLKEPEQRRNPVLALRRDPEKVVASPIITKYSRIPARRRFSTFKLLSTELRDDKKMSIPEFLHKYPQFYHVTGYASQVYYNAIINALIKVDARLVTNELNVSQITPVVLNDVDQILVAQCAVRNGISSELLNKAVDIRQKANCPPSFIYENLDNIRIALKNQPFLRLSLKETIKKMLEGEGGGGAPPANVAPRPIDLRILTKIRITVSFFFVMKIVLPIVSNWFKN